jgi:hypothetical protein
MFFENFVKFKYLRIAVRKQNHDVKEKKKAAVT